jgi:hypothetical protein
MVTGHLVAPAAFFVQANPRGSLLQLRVIQATYRVRACTFYSRARAFVAAKLVDVADRASFPRGPEVFPIQVTQADVARACLDDRAL